MKKLFALLLAMVLVFSLAACGSDAKKDEGGDKQNIEENNGKVPPADKDAEYIGIWYCEDAQIGMEFTENGTCVLSYLDMDQENVLRCTEKDGILIITMDGEEIELSYEIDGDSAVFTSDGEALDFERVESLDDIVIEDDENFFEDIEVDGEIDEALVGMWYSLDEEDGFVEFNPDNTCTIEDSDESVNAQWYVDGNALIFVMNGVELYTEYEIEEEKLTMAVEDGETLTFEKE